MLRKIAFIVLTGSFSLVMGQKYKWSGSFGNTGADVAAAVVTDNAGNLYVTGNYQGTVDFDPGASTVNQTSVGSDDVFVSKFNSSGALLWTKSIGSTAQEQGRGIAVDAAGAVYFTGYYGGTMDCDPGAGVFNLTLAGGFDGFIVKLSSAGNFIWAKGIRGATSTDAGSAIYVDAAANVYTTGWFQGTVDFNPNAGVANLTSNGGQDIFIQKLDSAGNYIWAKSMGGAGQDVGRAIRVDNLGNVYTTGYYIQTVDFDPGAGVSNLVSATARAVFLSKLDANGNYIYGIDVVNGSANNLGLSLALDASGNILVSGQCGGAADFDPGAGTLSLTPVGVDDIFISKISSSGNLMWAKLAGGIGTDIGSGITCDSDKNVYVTGYFNNSVDFNPGSGIDSLISAGLDDLFILSLDSAGNYNWAKSTGSSASDQGRAITVSVNDEIYTCGYFNNTVDFNFGTLSNTQTGLGANDCYIAKYCLSSIAGHVQYSSGAVNNGYARLYHNRFGALMEKLDSTNIDPLGNFLFKGVTEDSITIYAFSNTTNTIGTYFGDTCAWIPGDSQIVVCGTNPVTINLDEIIPMTGSGSVSGSVVQGINFGRFAFGPGIFVPGSPIGGIDVGVRKKPAGTIVGMTQTDASGNYTIGNIDPGNYEIYVDIPGLPMIDTIFFTITSNENITAANFIGDSANIYINTTTSDNSFLKNTPTELFVYPNPASSLIHLVCIDEMIQKSEWYNSIGELMKADVVPSFGYKSLQTDLPNGFYFLRVTTEKGLKTVKIQILR